MKKGFIYFCISLCAISTKAQNADSLIYSGPNTSGSSTSIAKDDAPGKTNTFANADYSNIDKYVLQLKGRTKNIPQLAKSITGPFTTDEDKVRAIFRWMTNNIAYDCNDYHNKHKKIGAGVSYSRKTPKEIKAGKWEYQYYNYATRILRTKKGVCEGYATLFYELCNYSGLQCEVVYGKVNTDVDGKPKYSGHAWNEVRIGNEWYFTDVCWASGYVDDKVSKFTKSLNNTFYLTPVDKPFEDHIANKRQTKKRNDLVGNFF